MIHGGHAATSPRVAHSARVPVQPATVGSSAHCPQPPASRSSRRPRAPQRCRRLTRLTQREPCAHPCTCTPVSARPGLRRATAWCQHVSKDGTGAAARRLAQGWGAPGMRSEPTRTDQLRPTSSGRPTRGDRRSRLRRGRPDYPHEAQRRHDPRRRNRERVPVRHGVPAHTGPPFGCASRATIAPATPSPRDAAVEPRPQRRGMIASRGEAGSCPCPVAAQVRLPAAARIPSKPAISHIGAASTASRTPSPTSAQGGAQEANGTSRASGAPLGGEAPLA